ncbi:MAG: hypothetical protein V4660_17165 [Pseudomonadota bacterium]
MDLHKHKEKYLLGILLLAYFILRCFFLDTVPRWDAAMYWNILAQAVTATKEASGFTALYQVILEHYNAYGHPSMGYYSLLVLGQLIDYPNLFMLNMTNALLAMLSVFSVYKILRWFLPTEQHLPEVLLATAAYALEPLFFGCSIYLNTDFPVLVFFTAGIASLLYGRYGWFAVSCLFLVFSKETGLLFWLTMVGGVGLNFVCYLVRELGAGRRPKLAGVFPAGSSTQEPTKLTVAFRFLCLVLPGIIFTFYTMAQKGKMWANDNGLKFDSEGWNCFGFNPKVMANRAGEIFILDFHWVPALAIIAALFIWLGRSMEKSKRTSIQASVHTTVGPDDAETKSATDFKQSPNLSRNIYWGLFPIALSALAFLAFNISYITFIIPRYVMQAGFFLIVFLVLVLPYAFTAVKQRCAILSVILLLFTLQTFRTIDPLSLWAFGSAPFNDSRILQIDSPGEAVGNGFVYNSEFTAVDKLFNRMQKMMPLKPDTVIIAWNGDEWYPWFYNGNVFVDPVTLNRTMASNNTFHYNVIHIGNLDATQAPNNAFYVYMPWLSKFSNEESELTQLRSLYKISEPTEVKSLGHSLRYYRLERLAQ